MCNKLECILIGQHTCSRGSQFYEITHHICGVFTITCSDNKTPKYCECNGHHQLALIATSGRFSARNFSSLSPVLRSLVSVT